MLLLTCTIISSVDFAHYRVPRAKDWVSVDCGSIHCCNKIEENMDANLFHIFIGKTTQNKTLLTNRSFIRKRESDHY